MRLSLRPVLTAMSAALLALTVTGRSPAQDPTAPDSSFEQNLQALSPQTAAECLEVAARLDDWAKTYTDLQRLCGQLYTLFKTRPDGGAGDDALTAWVGKVDAVLKGSAKLRALVGDRIDRRVRDAGGDQAKAADLAQIYEDEARAAVRAWAVEWVGQVESDLSQRSGPLRTLLRYADRIQAKARELQKDGADALAAAKAYRDAAYQAVQALRDPAAYAKSFVEGAFKDQFLNHPQTIGGATITVIQADPTKSLFSRDANVGVQLEYAKLSGFKLKAYGLYFRYRKGQVPEPRVERLKVDAGSLASLANAGLKSLGDALPDFGMPITISNLQFTDFSAAGGKRNGSLQFHVSLGLSKLLDAAPSIPDLEGDIVAYADGRIDVSSVTAAIKTPVPIGTSGLIFDGGWVKLQPQDKQKTVTLGTSIAPATGGKEGVSLNVQASFGFPVTKTGIAYQGSLVLGGGQLSLGKVQGVISPQKVTFVFDTTPGATPYTVHLEGELNAKALTGKATLSTVLGIGKADGAFLMAFNGNGWVNLSSDLEIGGGLKAAANFSASYGPGFRNLTLDGALTVEADVDPLGKLEASLAVHAQRDPQPLIRLSGTAAGQGFDCTLTDFGQLYDALKKRLLDLRGQLYDGLARAEKAAGKWAADREKALDQWVYANAKAAHLDRVSLDNGGPIDQAMGRASSALKGVGGDLTNFRDNLGKAAVNVRQTAEAAGSHAADVVTNVASDPVGAVTGVVQHPGRIIGLGLTDPTPALRTGRIGKVAGSAARFEFFGGDVSAGLHNALSQVRRSANQAVQLAELNRRLVGVLSALDRARVVKSQHPRSGLISELRLKFDRSLAHPTGDGNAVISFGVQAAGFRYNLDPQGRKAARPQSASDYRVGEIRLTGLIGRTKPRAQIVLAKLNNASAWDADKLVRDTLNDLLERQLPGAQLSGRFEERRLAVHNHAAEPIRVWVQTETRSGGRWQWLPTQAGQAYSYVIPPGKTLALNRERADLGLTGRRVRLWAESESGQLWPQYQRKDLWLVDERDADGSLRYYGNAMQLFVYNFWAGKGPRTFHERTVQVRNATDKPLQVYASSLSQDPNGKGEWDKTPKWVPVPPGQTVALRQANGWYLRGSETKLWAEQDKGGSFRWKKPWTAPVRQVLAAGYRGEKIEPFVFVLEPLGHAPAPAASAVVHLRPDEVRVPAVKGLTLQEARAELLRAELQPGHPAGAALKAKVLAQLPASGWAAPGTAVRLTLQMIDERVRVPDFTNSTLESAQVAAKRVGLPVQQRAGATVPTRHTKDRALAGSTLVETQSVAHGQMVARGTPVTVTLVRYVLQTSPPPVRVPNFYHSTLEAAQLAASREGLEVQQQAGARVPTLHTRDRALAGRTLIETQSVASGQTVARGSVVTVTLARFVFPPPPVTIRVPFVRGKTYATARAAIEAAGLTVRTVNSPANGPVEGVSPAEGMTVQRGSTVVLTFPVRHANPNLGGKGNTPPPAHGNFTGRWVLAQQRLVVRFEQGSVAEVGHLTANGGFPARWMRGRYSYAGNSLTVQATGLNLRGTVRWAGANAFSVHGGDGREYHFQRR